MRSPYGYDYIGGVTNATVSSVVGACVSRVATGAAAIAADHPRSASRNWSTPNENMCKISTLRSLNFSAAARLDLSAFPADWPEVEYWSENAWVGPELGSPPPDARNYASMAIGLIAPLSRGWVSINSSDMSSPPVINPNWLTNSTDQVMAVAAIRRARQYFQTPAMQSIVIGEEAFPGPNITTDSEILAILRRQLTTFYHAAATCKMGKRSDHMAVVNSEARVIGVENLRVVDISAFPFLPQSPVHPRSDVFLLQ